MESNFACVVMRLEWHSKANIWCQSYQDFCSQYQLPISCHHDRPIPIIQDL